MSEISKAYEPQSVEDKWYDFWLKQGCFTADPKSAKPAYSIVIPPPNVTGMLHMGHVLNNTIQDILSRKARMDGKEVLWLPGTDHAGIATQVMVEKQLKKEEKKSRHDLGREEFLKRVWAWKEKHGDIIINQLKKLGCSCDWTRERFTMDPEYSRCVQKVFVELYKKGLIYRGKRMVNWCPVSQTALSDEEVEMKPQKGFMYHFRVEAVEADGSPVKGVSGHPLMDLPDVFGHEQIVPELKATNRWEAIDELIGNLIATGKIQTADRDAVTAAIKKRETSMTTGIGFGIGIPHASTDLVHEVVGVLGRSKNGINFGSLDNQPVKLVMLFLVPQGQFHKHLHTLANIAKLLHKREFREALETFSQSPTAIKQKDGPKIDSQGRVWLTIATTRPETIPGDTAVAVNPKDPRYAHLIGRFIVRPLPAELPRAQKLIPIIGDEQVDFEFGTGVLKVTPAHDKADFDIGTRHKLPLIEVINADGSMNDLAGADLRGLDRFKARKIAVEKLRELEMLVEEKPYENNVGFSQRADVPIEPRLSEQWFLKYPAVEPSKACVEQELGSTPAPGVGASALAGDSGRVQQSGNVPTSARAGATDGASAAAPEAGALPKMRFHPQRWAKVYDHWLTNIQDWCISRQLWWGHRIPVWKESSNSSSIAESNGIDLEKFLNSLTQEDSRIVYQRRSVGGAGFTGGLAYQFERYVAVAPGREDVIQKLEQLGFTQDSDVLDTWFSSWLWPFATMGWPESTDTLKKFYPTTDLVTGPDIIFFWVARMIMAGYEFMGEAKFALPDAMPFQNVYFTGIIRDKQGRKMSKTLGNSPDPLVLIAQYGADALRFGTMRSAPLGQDVLFDEKDVELGRNFCNKLWNACRFRQMVGGQSAAGVSPADRTSPESQNFRQDAGSTFEVQGEIERTLLTPDDKWILLKLDAAIREVTIALNEYKFSEATAALYRFFWNEYCDWYVEVSKAILSSSSRGSEAQTEKAETDQSLLTSAATNAQKANTLAVIDFVLSHAIRMFHPFLPFITEELWHGMGYSTDMPENQGGKTIMNAPWPLPFDTDFKSHYGLDDCYLEMTDTKYELVRNGRDLRRAGNIQAAKKVKYVFKPAQFLTPHDAEVIKLLLNAESLEVNADYQPPKGTPTVQSKLGELFLPLEGLIDVAAEKIRLAKEVEKIQSEIVKVEQKLANPNFTTKVPPAVLAEHEQRLADWKIKLAHAQASLAALG